MLALYLGVCLPWASDVGHICHKLAHGLCRGTVDQRCIVSHTPASEDVLGMVALIVWQLVAIVLGEVLASLGWLSGQMLQESRLAVEASGAHRLRILSDVWLLIQQHPWMG
jgi:hypothetical protein